MSKKQANPYPDKSILKSKGPPGPPLNNSEIKTHIIPVDINFDKNVVGTFVTDEKIKEMLDSGLYEFAASMMMDDNGKMKIVSLSLVPKPNIK